MNGVASKAINRLNQSLTQRGVMPGSHSKAATFIKAVLVADVIANLFFVEFNR